MLDLNDVAGRDDLIHDERPVTVTNLKYHGLFEIGRETRQHTVISCTQL